MLNVDKLMSIHHADEDKVNSMITSIQDNDDNYCFKPIYVREIYGQDVIIDGVHRAKACWLQSIDAEIEYVEENELLTDQEIVMMDLIEISKV
jgi:ParB-like nuclease domain